MACEVTATFVNLPASPQIISQIRQRSGACGAAVLNACCAHVELRPRHNALGSYYHVEIDAELAAPGGGHCSAHSSQDDLAVAVDTAFSSLAKLLQQKADMLLPASRSTAASGHISAISRSDGTGLLALDCGTSLHFLRNQMAGSDFEQLHPGDRAWWIPSDDKTGDADGTLVCIGHRGRSSDGGPGPTQPSLPQKGRATRVPRSRHR